MSKRLIEKLSIVAVAICFIAVSFLGSAAHQALAAATWASPVNVSNTSGSAGIPGLAIDSSGGLHVVWYDDTPGNSDILYSTKPSGGSWSSSVNISNNSGGSGIPRIAIDGSSGLHVVWFDDTPGNFDILYSTKPSGGSWSDPVNVSNNSGDSGYPGIAMDGSGGLHVVWSDDTPGNLDIFYSTKPSGGSWSTSVNISDNLGNSKYPAIAIDSSGGLHVVWHDNTPGNYDIFYSTKPSGGSWSTSVNISDN